jgi:O-antigen/teichoic acid export membrane protein
MGYLFKSINEIKISSMKKNMGSTDKTIRLVAALVIVILAFAKVITGVWAVVLLILAAVFVITSLVSFCPLYLPFGMNTGKKKE